MAKCLKGKSEVGEESAKFECKKCGALTDIKGHICAPEQKKGGKKQGGAEDNRGRKTEKALERLKKAQKELARAQKKVAKATEKLEKAKGGSKKAEMTIS